MIPDFQLTCINEVCSSSITDRQIDRDRYDYRNPLAHAPRVEYAVLLYYADALIYIGTISPGVDPGFIRGGFLVGQYAHEF